MVLLRAAQKWLFLLRFKLFDYPNDAGFSFAFSHTFCDNPEII